MKVVTMWSLVPCLVIAGAVPAFCQDSGRTAEPFSRAYISASTGASFASTTKVTFAGEYGERVTDILQAYANLTYFENLMSDRMRGYLAVASAELTDLTGARWNFRGRDRGLALTVGAKIVAPTASAIRPYAGAGLGTLHVRRTISEAARGNVTESFIDEFGPFGLNDGILGSTSDSATKPLGELIAGVNIVSGRTYLDVSYRYRHAFRAPGSLSFAQLAVGVGVRF